MSSKYFSRTRRGLPAGSGASPGGDSIPRNVSRSCPPILRGIRKLEALGRDSPSAGRAMRRAEHSLDVRPEVGGELVEFVFADRPTFIAAGDFNFGGFPPSLRISIFTFSAASRRIRLAGKDRGPVAARSETSSKGGRSLPGSHCCM